MPNYSFLNKETNEEFEDFMSISAMTEFLENNPHIVRTIKNIEFVSGNGGVHTKTADGFKDILRTIKKNNPGSTIDV